MSISCFGASVTQQQKGYSFYLQKLLKKNINVHGFGSEHLVYGGMVHINKVLKYKPSLCFIDWFTTGWISTDEITITALDTIKYKFSISNCKIIFLFFPRKDHHQRVDFYNFVKEYLNSNHISFIDINDHLTYSNKIISDDVHTTEYGAEKYANIIFNEYNNMKIKSPINLNKNKFCDLKELQINKIFKKELELKGNCQILSCSIRVGPNSGYLKINNKLYLIWDPWCHYVRSSTKLNFFVKDKCEIKILDKEVDHSSCKRNFKFKNIEFELNLITIYYIGDSLELVKGC
tara:strand:- start:396 stop:1265 length:870 start_codon:yes stop_codon:yes gene_type:complete